MEGLDSVINPLREFSRDSVRLIKRCQKLDRNAIGLVVMGSVGFFVKLIFIPINNIIVGAA